MAIASQNLILNTNEKPTANSRKHPANNLDHRSSMTRMPACAPKCQWDQQNRRPIKRSHDHRWSYLACIIFTIALRWLLSVRAMKMIAAPLLLCFEVVDKVRTVPEYKLSDMFHYFQHQGNIRPHIDLNRWHNQARYIQCCVTRLTHFHKLIFGDAIMDMNIRCPLFANTGLPFDIRPLGP